MKVKNVVVCLLVPFLSLYSCSRTTKRTNIIVPGEYYFLDTSGNEEIAYF